MSDVVFVILVILLIAVFSGWMYSEMVVEDPMSGRVTDISHYKYNPTSTIKYYLAELGGVYYRVGKSAGKNLRVNECYLLRKGAFSEVYNLFEPVECKEGQ